MYQKKLNTYLCSQRKKASSPPSSSGTPDTQSGIIIQRGIVKVFRILPTQRKYQAVKKFHEVARRGGCEAIGDCLAPMQCELVRTPHHLLVQKGQKVRLRQKVFRCPHDLNIELPPHVCSQNGKKAFVGPHHCTKIARQKQPTSHQKFVMIKRQTTIKARNEPNFFLSEPCHYLSTLFETNISNKSHEKRTKF